MDADTPLDQQDRPHSDTSDACSATLTDNLVDIEQSLHDRLPVIWPHRDSTGTGQALVERTESGPLAGSSHVIKIISSSMSVTLDGQLQPRKIPSKA